MEGQQGTVRRVRLEELSLFLVAALEFSSCLDEVWFLTLPKQVSFQLETLNGGKRGVEVGTGRGRD